MRELCPRPLLWHSPCALAHHLGLLLGLLPALRRDRRLGLVLVTHNTREFARVPGLAIEAGRDSRDQGSPKVACSAPSPHSNPCPAHRGETVQVCKDGDSWRRSRGREMITRPSWR